MEQGMMKTIAFILYHVFLFIWISSRDTFLGEEAKKSWIFRLGWAFLSLLSRLLSLSSAPFPFVWAEDEAEEASFAEPENCTVNG